MEITAVQEPNLENSNQEQAYDYYREGQYKHALPLFQAIVEAEPSNYHAHLVLGVCYFYTKHANGAKDIFRFVADNCGDKEYKSKALLALSYVFSSFGQQELHNQTASIYLLEAIIG
jgi:thioredoxin-like negative regulator of GroEL